MVVIKSFMLFVDPTEDMLYLAGQLMARCS
jgi:hypothetical protein